MAFMTVDFVAQSNAFDKSTSRKRTAPDFSSKNWRVRCWMSVKAFVQPFPFPGVKANCPLSISFTTNGKIHFWATNLSNTLEIIGRREIGLYSSIDGSGVFGIGVMMARLKMLRKIPVETLQLKISVTASASSSENSFSIQDGIRSSPGTDHFTF